MLIKSYITNSLPTICKGLIGIVILRLLAEYSGAEGLGQIAQMQAIVALVFAFINGIFFNYVVSSSWSKKNSKEIEFRDALGLIFIVTTVVGLILLSTKNFIGVSLIGNKDLSFELLLLSIMCPVTGIYTAMSARLCSEGYLTQFNILNTFGMIISSIIIFISLVKFGINGAFIGVSIFYLCPSLIIFVGYLKYLGKNNQIIRFSLLKEFPYRTILTFSGIGLYMVLSAIALKMLVRDEIYGVLGWGEVGNWEVINKISETYLLIVTAPITTYMMPTLLKYTDKKLKYQLIGKVLLIGIIFIIAATILTYVAWNTVIVKIIGIQFVELRKYIYIQQVGDIFKIITWTLCIVAIVNKKYTFVLVCEILWCVTYYGMFTQFLPKYGIKGTFYAHLFSYLILSIVFIYEYTKVGKNIEI